MFWSAATFCTLPRLRTSRPTNSSCSGVSRPTHPRLKAPSITRPLWGASSRVTISSPPVTGSRVISGFSGNSPPFRATLCIAPYPCLGIPRSLPLPLVADVVLDTVVAQSYPPTRCQVSVAVAAHLAHEGGIYPVVIHLDQLIRRRPGEAERMHLAHVVRVHSMA